VGDITWARASFNSVRGKIVSEWKRDGDKFTLRVTIPPNTTARVSLPSWDLNKTLANSRPIGEDRDIKFVRQAGDRAILQVGSGSHEFTTAY
jgi:alpha-L-rhamnosidase